MLIENCPVGLRALKRRFAWVGQALLGMLVSLSAVLGLSNLRPIQRLEELVAPHHTTMGMMRAVVRRPTPYQEIPSIDQEREAQTPPQKN